MTKFFGGVARFHPKEVCSSNKTFVNSVFEGLSSRDLTQKSISVQTVGFIGESVEGKMALDKLGLYRVYMAISKIVNLEYILKIVGYSLPKTCTYGDMFHKIYR